MRSYALSRRIFEEKSSLEYKLKRSIGYRAVEAELSIYYIDYTVTQNEHVIMQVRVSGGGMGKDSSPSLLTFFNVLIVFNHKWRAEALY